MQRAGQKRSADDTEGPHMLLRNRIARAAAVAALALAVLTLSGCGMNFATDKVYTPAAGANDREGRVDVLNAMIVSSEDGKGTLTVTVSNNERVHGTDETDVSDTLTEVGGEITATGFKPVEIPPAGYVRFASEETPSVQPRVDQPGIPVTGDFVIGDFVDVTLSFENAAPVTVQAPVMPHNSYLEGETKGSPVPTLPERVEAEHGSTEESH